MTDLSGVRKIAHVVPVSRGYALREGWVDPTPEEAAEEQRSRAAWEAHQAALAAWREAWDRWRPCPVAAAVLAVHAEGDYGCQGDHGDEGDIWPCRTVLAVAAAEGLPCPEYQDFLPKP